ncbi:haloacid dehalogenase, partial [Candidatus Endoriftia persephone str. Guaymas]|nr:haloacid dehalogenase [Candidatus Endoriftia persephone str. Guaymas]
VDRRGVLPGAEAFIHRLNAMAIPYLVLTNSASRLPSTMVMDYLRQRLEIAEFSILTSGMLLEAYFVKRGLVGCGCLVLGPEESEDYVRRAGGYPEPLREGVDADVLVIADQKGFDCVEGMNKALSMVMRRFDMGHPVELVLCNPDIIYPLSPGEYGFTSGGLAAMIEALLLERYGQHAPRFARLGKPYAPIFDQALQLLNVQKPIMIGDQLATDIAGANRAGIDSALVSTGLGGSHPPRDDVRPTWYLQSLVSF